jgi:protein-S-isoprenylcysteine O-methyltransferase Ste14
MKFALIDIFNDVLVGVVLFGSAGTLNWPRAWVLLSVMLVIRMLGTWSILRVNPALLKDRARLPVHRGQPLSDRVLLPAFMLSYALVVAFDGFDATRFHILGSPNAVVASAGLSLIVFGWGLVMVTMRTNAYATTVVRYQEDRGHEVVSTGIYGYVRHPMYAGLIVGIAGMGLWLGTNAGALATVVPASILVVRIVVEEGVLRAKLAGYDGYAGRVRYRLVPGLW